MKILQSLHALFIICTFWIPSQCYFSGTYIIKDLNETNSTLFLQETAQWTTSNETHSGFVPNVTICNGTALLVGDQTPNVSNTMQRTYLNLTTHTSVFVTFDAWVINNWNTSNKIIVSIMNNDTFSSNTQVLHNPTALINGVQVECSPNITCTRRIIPVQLSVNHVGSNLTLNITSQTFGNISTDFFGIRNLQILLSSSNFGNSYCAYGNLGSTSDKCYCNRGQYLGYFMDDNNDTYSSCTSCNSRCLSCGNPGSYCSACKDDFIYDGQNCAPCHSTCETCIDVGELKCLKCKPGYYKYRTNLCLPGCSFPFTNRTLDEIIYCDPPCNNGTGFLYVNNTCNETCNLPFLMSADANGTQHCKFKCNTGQYFFPNETCHNTCLAPFEVRQEGVESYCNCNPPNFNYWNSSCQTTCPSPLTITQKYNMNYCNYTCNQTEYLYWNKSCISTCDTPFLNRTDSDNHLYCYATCLAPNYLFEDGSCNTTCPSPINATNNEGVQLCIKPCTNTSNFYYPENQTCMGECPEPRIINITDFYNICLLPPIPELSPEEVKQIQALADMGNTAGAASSAGLTVANAVSPGDPGGISAGMLAKMLQYAKYLNITYTLKLELMFQVSNTSAGPLAFGPKMSPDLKNKFDELDIPYNFAKHKVHSSFIINYWNNAMTLIIVFGAVVLLRFIEWVGSRLNNPFILRLARTTVQNFLFTQFYNTFGDVILFGCLEMKTSRLDSGYSALSFVICLVFLSIGILAIVLHLSTLWKYQSLKKYKKRKQMLDNFNKENQGLQVLFASFKDVSFMSQGYLLFFVFRIALVNFTLVFIHEYPTSQTIIMTVLTLIMLLYLVIMKPFKTIINLIQQVSFELTLSSVNICLVIFAILNDRDDDVENIRNDLSQVIMISSLIFTFLPPVFLVAKVIVAGYQFYQQRRLNKAKKDSSSKKNSIATQREINIKKRFTKKSINNETNNISKRHIVIQTNTLQNAKGQQMNNFVPQARELQTFEFFSSLDFSQSELRPDSSVLNLSTMQLLDTVNQGGNEVDQRVNHTKNSINSKNQVPRIRKRTQKRKDYLANKVEGVQSVTILKH